MGNSGRLAVRFRSRQRRDRTGPSAKERLEVHLKLGGCPRGVLQRDGDPEQVRAVPWAILHESAHQRRHDVLWRIALAALEAALHPLPAGRRLAANIALEWELAADREAIRAGARREHLFEALVAASIPPSPGAGVALSSVGTMQRLEVLATGQGLPRRNHLAYIGGYLAALALVPLAVHLGLLVGGRVPLSSTAGSLSPRPADFPVYAHSPTMGRGPVAQW